MKRTPLALGLFAALLVPAGAMAQDAKPAAKPAAQPDKKPAAAQPPADEMADMAAVPLGPEHDMLKDFEGKWKARMQMFMDGEVMESEGTMTNTLVLDGRFLRQDFKSELMGQPFKGLGYWGYDRASKQWVTSWMDTWNTGMMTSDKGAYDAGTKTWTIDSTYTNPETGAKEIHREVIRLIDSDSHAMDLLMVGDDGTATKTMTITYTRIGAKGEAKGHDKHDHKHEGGKDNKPPKKN